MFTGARHKKNYRGALKRLLNDKQENLTGKQIIK